MKKNIFLASALVLAILSAFFYPQCAGKVDPGKPPVVADSVHQDWHCTPIAPMQTTERAVGMRGKFHQVGATLKIGFIGGTTAQRDAVKAAYARWAQSANLKFEYPASGNTNIRVSFSPGSAWSYVGIDCNSIPQQYATLNFGFGGTATIDHEAGHSLALLHEQQLAGGVCWNEANVIADLSGPPNNWNLATIRFNVLDYHNPANVITTGYDKTSIMHYSTPARWTCNNVAIPGGTAISTADRAFVSLQYPGVIPPPPPPPPPSGVTLTPAQRNEIVRLLNKSKATTDAAKVASDSANVLVKKIIGF